MRHVSFIALAALSWALSGPAHANTLDAQQRTMLKNGITSGCKQQMAARPEFSTLTRQLGRDISDPYCSCMADKASQSVTAEDISAMAKGGTLPAGLQQRMAQHAQSCMAGIVSTPASPPVPLGAR